MGQLGEKILTSCKLRGITLAKACELAEVNYSTLHSQIKKNRGIPFSTIDRFAAALNLPLGYFSQTKPSISVEPNETAQELQAEAAKALSDLMTKQVAAMADLGYRIGIDDVLDWLHAHDNMLVKHEWLEDRIDLFFPAKPNDKTVKPYKLGKQSLASRYFNLANTVEYTEVVEGFDQSLLSEVVSAHIEVSSKRYMITDKFIDQIVGNTRIKGTYRRLLAPVTDTDGTCYTMVFSKLTQFPGC